MKISTQKGVLEIPQDLDFEIKATHPFFSDEGSVSIPVTIPASASNSVIFDFPERIDRNLRHNRESDAIAECGVWRKKCKVITESAGSSSGISLCLAIAESDLYTSVRDRKLRDIFSGRAHVPTRSFLPTPYDAYKSLHLDPFGFDFAFALFPVAVDFDGSNNILVVNRPVGETIFANGTTVIVGSRSLSVPEGYGVAPYMYLYAMLDLAFTLSGFSVKSNCFADDENLKKIVILHNRADISANRCTAEGMNWSFYYADVVPDVTLGEMIAWLRDKFGAIVRNDSGEIYITLMRDIFVAKPDYDLTPLQATDESISYPEPQSLERSVDTSINSASPAADSLEDLAQKYTSYTEVTDPDDIAAKGLYYLAPLGKFYYHNGSAATMLGCSSFPYKRSSDFKAEDISTDDSFVPSIIVNGVTMPFVGKVAHAYVEDGGSREDQPILICYAHDILQEDGSYVMCGSSFSYDHTGTPVINNIEVNGETISSPNPPLTPEGLSFLWEEYEKILLNGAPEITLECDFPMTDLMTLDLTTPKLFKGARVLITEISYKVSDTPTTRAKLSLQLLPAYQDMISPAPAAIGITYTWEVVSTFFDFFKDSQTIDLTDGLEDYTINQAPEYTPRVAGIIANRRKRWLRYRYLSTDGEVFTRIYEWEEYFISVANNQ